MVTLFLKKYYCQQVLFCEGMCSEILCLIIKHTLFESFYARFKEGYLLLLRNRRPTFVFLRLRGWDCSLFEVGNSSVLYNIFF